MVQGLERMRFGLLLALAVACAPQGAWVTPKGEALAIAACEGQVPATGGGPAVCVSRQIDRSETAVASCKAEGGVDYEAWNRDGRPLLCVYPAADAGKSCQRSSDCEIACDAATRQCRGIDGLGEVLDDQGGRQWAMR